jgi:RNA polymerase sigma-70 factor (ECF subfamily)
MVATGAGMDEAQMIHYAREGDLDAFNRLVLAYQDMAYNLAYRMMGDPASADDVTQEAFISAYRKLDSFRGGSFKAWLLRIVTNASYDELRRLKRRPTTPLEPTSNDNEAFESPVWLKYEGETPEETALRAELNTAIQNCLEGLEPDFRAVVVMVDVQGMDYSDAASAIQKPLGTVKSRLARARVKMQECLRAFGELLPAAFRLEDERIV